MQEYRLHQCGGECLFNKLVAAASSVTSKIQAWHQILDLYESAEQTRMIVIPGEMDTSFRPFICLLSF